MTDPLMPAFCCKRPGKWTQFYDIMLEIDSNPYNTICLFSSTCGILGAMYQILPSMNSDYSYHWFWMTSCRSRKTVIWLAFADLFASLGIFIRSIMKLVTPIMIQKLKSNSFYCYLLGFWIQYFYVVSWFWTFIYAIDIWLALKEKPAYSKTYHCISWILPGIFTFIGLYILYYPDSRCFYSAENSFWRFFPNYLVSYLPMLTVMIVNPILYSLSSGSVHIIVSQYLSQYTNRERHIVDMIKIKFGLINLTFYACWLPNLITMVILYTNWDNFPRRLIISMWYIMAIMNPLQALFNSLVYQKPQNKVMLHWNKGSSLMQNYYEPNETTPLLARNSGSSNHSDEPDFIL